MDGWWRRTFGRVTVILGLVWFFVVGLFLFFMWTLAPWGEFRGIGEDAWLGFWASLLSAVSAAAVAVGVLTSQTRKQDEHLTQQLSRQAHDLRAQLELQETQHRVGLATQQDLQAEALRVQREEARREREIAALTILVRNLHSAFLNDPDEGWAERVESCKNEAHGAILSWRMNWGDAKEDASSLELDFMSATDLYVYAASRGVTSTESEAMDGIQRTFGELSTAAVEYPYMSRAERVKFATDFTADMAKVTGDLYTELVEMGVYKST